MSTWDRDLDRFVNSQWLNDPINQAIIKLLKQKLTYKQIGEKLSLSPTAIHNRLKRGQARRKDKTLSKARNYHCLCG